MGINGKREWIADAQISIYDGVEGRYDNITEVELGWTLIAIIEEIKVGRRHRINRWIIR